MNFPSEQIRADFPILSRKINGHPLVYLDSAASSQKPRQVMDAVTHFLSMNYANIHRGVYTIAEEATELYEQARAAVRDFIGATEAQEIIFTRGTTESINLVRFSWGRKKFHAGDEIWLTEMEHHSNLVPWQLLAEETGAKLRFIPFDQNGELQLDVLRQGLTQKSKLVAVIYASNTFGTINPVREIIKIAHQKNIPVLLDAAQAVPSMPINVQELDCDFLAFSGHKMLGPTGIGVLYAKRAHLEAMDPFMGGGEMIKTVELEHSTWNDVPWKFEAGTQAISEAVGLGAAIQYLKKIGMEKVRDQEKFLTHYAMERLHEVPDVTLYGPEASKRGGVIAFNLKGIHPHDVATVLDRNGIAVRAGHHCTQPLHRKLGLDATVRASFYIYNTTQEIDLMISCLKEAHQFFKS